MRNMSSYPTSHPRDLPSVEPLLKVVLALVAGTALFLILGAALLVGYDLYHAGRIFPGTYVGGVDLSGLTQEQAAARLTQEIGYLDHGRIAFEERGEIWIASPNQLGLQLDARNSARAAYQLGRHGNLVTRFYDQFIAWYSGKYMPPILVYDARAAQKYLQGLAPELERPTIEASLDIDGVQVVAKPGQIGRRIDYVATLAPLEDQLRSLTDGIVPVVIEEIPPQIMDASAQAEVARQILSAPLVLQVDDPQEGDPGPWTFKPQEMAGMLAIERTEGLAGPRFKVGLEAEGLRGFLKGIAPEFAREPANARFIFNDDTRQLEVIQPAVIGREMDVDATIQAINEQVNQGKHTVSLVFDTTNPSITDEVTAQELGITELVHAETSYFYGSSMSRMQNIQTASARFHGVLIPPGETFSMAQALGDVSLDNGYQEALIIYGDRTIKGVGGGVCQVSTTLFRTVFFSGFPVVERHPHAYRVYYYELTASGSVDTRLAGLDATVFVPMVDFKFTNDTPNWLLMETYVNIPARSLTWKFYSTSDGRSVEWDSTGLKNTVEPEEPVYQENPDLDKGEIEQVDWEVEGADVTVTRQVSRDGQVILEDSFSTHYMPWRAVYEYGPGTKIPKDKKNKDD
jgi:vancomycin resistance protein YoaR